MQSVVPIQHSVLRAIGKPASSRSRPDMNYHQPHALTSRIDTGRLLRRRTSVARSTVLGAFLLADFTVIVAMSWLTGISYHLIVHQYAGDSVNYLKVGLLSAIVFVLPNLFRGEYQPAQFLHLQAASAPLDPALERDLRVPDGAGLPGADHGRLFARLDALVLRLHHLRAAGAPLRYVQMTVLGSRTGLISAQRIFLVGAGRNIEDFVTRYHPRTFGISIVGCHFLTPVEAQAPLAAREQALARDLEQVIVGPAACSRRRSSW